MARRTRRFESLEERRLLAAVNSSPDAAALVGSASPVTTPSTPAASSAGGVAVGTPSASDASSNEYGATPTGYSEYAAPATAGSYTEPGTGKYYPPANSNPTAPAAATTGQSAQAALVQLLPLGQAIRTSADAQAAVLSPGAAGAPAAGAAGGPVRFDPHDLVARWELDEPVSDSTPPVAVVGDDQPLTAPVAWANSGEDRPRALFDADTAALPVDRPPFLAGSPQVAGLIAGAIGADWSRIERGVDQLFERLERLGEELPSAATAWHVSECVVLTAGAAAAFEYVRAQFREGGTWQAFVDGGREPWEPRLRRRWLRPRKERTTH